MLVGLMERAPHSISAAIRRVIGKEIHCGQVERGHYEGVEHVLLSTLHAAR
jgi:hypothetical protein